MKNFLITVIVAGAAGGFIGWVFAQTIGERVRLSPFWAIPAFMLLGAGASLIGIVLANPARDDVVHAVAAIGKVTAPPEARFEVLTDVGRLAADAGQTAVAVETVQTIEAAAAASADPRAALAASRGLAELRLKAEARDDLVLRRSVDEAARRAPAPPPNR